MGSRLLRRWIAMPLKDISAINNRLEVVDYFQKFNELSDAIHQQLKEIGDLERLTAKLATARIIPREVVQIKRSLEASNEIKKILANSQNAALKNISDQLNPCETLIAEIEKQIKEDAPVSVNKGMVFNEGVNADLDELRSMAYSGKDYLVNMQIRESERTGITSLKVGFNNVFGYFIEVTNSHKSKVPEEWIRKQTLTNAERYITEELKEYETKILGAEEKILALEVSMYEKFVQWLTEFIGPLQNNAKLLAQLDCLASFATVSKENNYKRPEVNDGKSIVILEGRHPVIEKALPVGENYVSNDLYLDEDSQQILVITGPNMSGKSALLRQTAIIVLMAQMGCFVPAKEARIGAVDKIFTRVGASDNLSQGESTFMVEMNETAGILNNLSEKSLILLDEIGRGTSTYDGISIAWSIAEYLHEHPKFRAKTLFATHYHELNEMAVTMPRIKNFHVSVKEHGNKVIFLRKLVPGGSEHSFGIHVAKMAGMPKEVLRKANEVLEQLEKMHKETGNKSGKKSVTDNFQLSFFQLEDPCLKNIKEEIENLDINTLTPVEALMKLNEIKKILGVKK
jgi:DNA mismatch repair protein MutS